MIGLSKGLTEFQSNSIIFSSLSFNFIVNADLFLLYKLYYSEHVVK